MAGPFIKIFSAWFVAAVFVLNVPGCEKFMPREEDRVLVMVGKSAITLGDFKEAMGRLLPEGTGEIKADELKELKRNLLNQLIEEELVIEQARRQGIVVSEDELAGEVEEIKLELGEGELEELIVLKYGSIEEWKEEIKRKLLVRKVIDEVIRDRVKVTDEEAKSYYEKNIKDYVVPAQVHARMIVVGTEEEARKVKKRLKKEDFKKVAEEVSLGPEATDGGDLGFFGRGDMPLEFEEVVFNLAVGKVSKVVKTPYGYHVFKVEEKNEGRKLEFKDVKDQIVEKLRMVEADTEFHKWIASLKKEIKIEVEEDVL